MELVEMAAVDRAYQSHEDLGWGQIGAWKLLQRTEAGSQRLELDVYDCLAVGDVLEIDFGTPEAEFITVTKFGSIIPAAPTRFPHNPGAEVRRIV